MNTYLLVTLFMFLGIVFYFLPGIGFRERNKKNKKLKKRILIEDSLKHIYDCEYNDIMCTNNSIAGSLHISSDNAAELVEYLKHLKLVHLEGVNIKLSSDGRTYALRIIRVHRLWEHYLADQTSMPENDWHKHAEKIEHKLSEDDVKELARKIGNPLIDPHGDPIPDEEGKLPKKIGVDLFSLEKDDKAEIEHVEDEPNLVYSQISAMGLHRGTQIRVLDKSENKIVFEANGDECVLSKLFSNNISVTKIKDSDFIFENSIPLSDLRKGNTGVVTGISKACRGMQRRRLLDFGIVPGTEIAPQLVSSFGDPTAYMIKGTMLALRKSQSDQIYVKPKEMTNE